MLLHSPPPDVEHSGSHKPFVLLLAWLVVAIPLMWGVYQTLHTSLALFRTPPAAAHVAQSPVPNR